MHDKLLSRKASTLATCLKDSSHICVSLNRHLGSHKVQSQVWLGVSGSETSNLLEHALELRDQPGYRRCIGTGRWLSSAPLGTPRGTACRTAAGPEPGPRWAGTWLLSSQSSLKGEMYTFKIHSCGSHRNTVKTTPLGYTGTIGEGTANDCGWRQGTLGRSIQGTQPQVCGW